MIVDTSFIIDLMRNKKTAVEKLNEIETQAVEIIIPSVVIFELYIGLGRINLDKMEEEKISSVVDSFKVSNFDSNHAKIAGINLGRLYQKGNPVDPVDAQIAGTALILKQPVLTRNISHFERFEGLIIETYEL